MVSACVVTSWARRCALSSALAWQVGTSAPGIDVGAAETAGVGSRERSDGDPKTEKAMIQGLGLADVMAVIEGLHELLRDFRIEVHEAGAYAGEADVWSVRFTNLFLRGLTARECAADQLVRCLVTGERGGLGTPGIGREFCRRPGSVFRVSSPSGS